MSGSQSKLIIFLDHTKVNTVGYLCVNRTLYIIRTYMHGTCTYTYMYTFEHYILYIQLYCATCKCVYSVYTYSVCRFPTMSCRTKK